MLHGANYYVSIYIILSLLTCIFSSMRFFFVFSASIRASRTLFNDILFTVMHAELDWLSNTPLGQILNRFAVDFGVLDSKLAYDIAALFNRLFEILSILVSGVFLSPMAIGLFALPVAGASYFAPRYLAIAREIKRLESTTVSPIIEQVISSLAGLTTIRAFSKAPMYMDSMHTLIDQHGQATWHLWLFNRWFNLRMSMIGAIFCMLVAALAAVLPKINAAAAGFTLSFAIQFPAALLWVIRQYTSVELSMNSAERVLEYANIPAESQDGDQPRPGWPEHGEVKAQDLTASYGNHLPALRGVSFHVKPGQTVGVVGRTGAGKSSLILALFRFLKASKGSITIDDVDISTLNITEFRRRLEVIPQDPVIFSGSVRSNLDPFGRHTDDDLYQALEQLGLTTPTERSSPEQQPSIIMKRKNIFSSLASPISEGGSNLSAGQRQLLSLCRVLISGPKILVLDEATSSVDDVTDALIQKSIRALAVRHRTTLLVIAHRLKTIIDFDAILVMDSGRVAEHGRADGLMQIDGGVFRSMVNSSSDSEALQSTISKLACAS